MSQYFQLFNISPSFLIDETHLEETYRRLAAQFHPDKFAASTSFEQKQAVMMSATINEAYRTLKNPIDRGAYLLKMQNIDADAPEHTSFPPEFLMQQMEWRETLMEAQMENDLASMSQLDAEIHKEQNNLQEKLHQAFLQQDYDSAAQLIRQGRFLNKMRCEIAAVL